MSRFAHGIYHDYIPPLYKHKDCSTALKSSVEAVGLATLSLARSESSLLEQARRHHLVAVREIQLSLQSPSTTNRADTLASVMLFALFAGITCEPTAAHINWTKHIKGALAILNSSSYLASDDPVVNILSSHVTSCVLVDCLQSVVSPPRQFTEIKFEPRIPVNFQEKSEYVLELLAEVRPQRVSMDSITDMIRTLDVVDAHLNDLFTVLSKRHPRMIVSNGDRIHQPVYHIYPSLKSARVWNIIRLTRLSAAELRYDKMRELRTLDSAYLHPHDIDIAYQEEYASTSAKLLIHDICASIPDFLRSTQPPNTLDPVEDLDAINWAHSMLWPLSTAQASKHAPEYLQQYMRESLQNMWDVTKFPVVDYHKKKIEEEIAPQIW